MSKSIQLQPVDATFTLKDHIYAVLRQAILEMDIYADDADLRLDERRMAERLGISRTPLREALARLERDGFVEIQPRRGVFVRRQSLNEVLEMIIVWAALESMAARLAVARASDPEIASLRGLAAEVDPSEASARIAEYSEANIRFHQRILELGRCGMLRSTADRLFLQMHAVRRRAMGESDRAKRSVADHMEIIEALEARDADLAARRVREHTLRLHDHVRATWTTLENARRRREETTPG
ncbi:MAG: GntR family transcriptional regulator [Pseudomonadota bacterium]